MKIQSQEKGSSQALNYSLLSDKSNKDTSTNRANYSFRPIKYMKLDQIYHEINKLQCQQFQVSLFPHNFAKLHKDELQIYLFEIQIEDMYKKWRIIKRLPQLIALKQRLQLKFPQSSEIFSFPEPSQSQLDQIYAKSILQLFVTFLTSICKSDIICQQKQFQIFVENWVSKDKKKIKTYFQRQLIKKAGGRHTESNFVRIMYNFISWRHKFFTVTSQGVFYTDDQDCMDVRQILLFSQSFSVIHGEIKTGYTYGLVINSSHRVLQVDAQNVFNFLFFIYFLRKALLQNESSKANKFNSFAKVRQNCCNSQFYIDGQDYFKSLYQALNSAKKSIYITGWFLSPHMYLLQQFSETSCRLDKILQKLAINDIKIYIILYNAPPIALYIDSQFTSSYLSSLHPNIKVLLHPNYMLIPFLWSHHEKLVLIDQKIAFMGGLDIGYGRMDNKKHALEDTQQQYWKGIEYCNYRITDITQVRDYDKSSIDRNLQPRMPWHDVGVKLTGQSVIDLCRHFIQYWNHVNFQLQLSQRQLILYTGIHEQVLESSLSLLQGQGCTIQGTEATNDKLVVSQVKQTISETIIHTFHNQPLLKQKVIDSSLSEQPLPIQRTTYFPLHDKHLNKKVNSTSFANSNRNKALMNDLMPQLKKLKSSEFVLDSLESQSQSLSKESEIKYYLKSLIERNSLSKKSINYVVEDERKKQNSSLCIEENTQDLKIKHQKLEDIILTEPQYRSQAGRQSQRKSNSNSQSCIKQTHQILRSASLWGLGLQQGKQQKSILQAYYSLIQNSKHFIYIQNQFFISVQNQISTKIVERIIKAFQEKQKFKVMIIVPFLPGFNGEIEDDTSAVFRIQIQLLYQTICKGEQSMLVRLSKILKDQLKDYLGIYCLRTHGVIKGIPVTEIVYVHSKIILVDDEVAIIGSANINDRSMLGTRDSQLAVVIEDGEEQTIGEAENTKKSNEENSQGQFFQSKLLPKIKVKKFAHQLRKSLYQEHFALNEQESCHFLNQKTWQKIQFNAQRNQKIYRKIFGCYPDNYIKSFEQINKLSEQAEIQRYEQLKTLIIGYGCPFQSDFLCKESLELHSGQKEYYIPYINFT